MYVKGARIALLIRELKQKEWVLAPFRPRYRGFLGLVHTEVGSCLAKVCSLVY